MRMRLSYANVAATLALVFSMSGGALAANHYLINSTKQINPKVLKTLKGGRGTSGTQGSQGAAGSIGPQGTSGSQGTAGAQGTTGLQGSKGLEGTEGPKGATGLQGLKGLEGTEGPKGATGPAGQARAYATITPGSPWGTLNAGSRGVVSAFTNTFTGSTCVILESSIDVGTAVPIATAHFGDFTFSANPGVCSVESVSGVQINGYNQNGTTNTIQAFSILVP
jgi:hypothetical protein